jgi:hypothetical protein
LYDLFRPWFVQTGSEPVRTDLNNRNEHRETSSAFVTKINDRLMSAGYCEGSREDLWGCNLPGAQMTPKIRLNQRVVDELSAPDPSGKQKFHWDRGFGVRCSGKTNGKSYVVQHDLPDGRARRITVGSAKHDCRG